jgi:mono/diheme cytochrome c family protein/glucose/arabinose dehydrogenase
MKKAALIIFLVSILGFIVLAVSQDKPKKESPFNPEMEDFAKTFKGAGEGVDGAGNEKPYTLEESLRHFQVVKGLEMAAVAGEPIIRQPINIHFDERGRLWVVQYLQYPFPAGLKIVKYDRYLRAVFDKVPPPPPRHDRGADKITILADKDGDGKFESHKDFVTGLNMTSSVAVGRGGVWVLNPPYLLFYPDRNRDDVPDGDPEVHLSGFGLEDTHAVVNSLHWGPDGWLYGTQGSTTTANIKGVKFLGQAIWRYQTGTRQFELFAEGGGNTWSVEFDNKGRLFSGTNYGSTRGLHYAQGGNYIKGFSKHGPLNNPFSFGYLQHMAHSGYQPRFSSVLMIYEGGALPGYEGQIIAGMSLTRRVQASQILPDTSTFKTVDTDPVVLTDNRWFRPVDIKLGPDGAVYMADWHDIRLSHLSPQDNWDKAGGRIYRLEAQGAVPVKPFDLGKLTSEELITYLSHKNKWFREEARRVMADRRDQSVNSRLQQMVRQSRGQLALEALWALYVTGGFSERFASESLNHSDQYVRSWTVRLLGDSKKVTPGIQAKLVSMAKTEMNPEVRSQLASTSKRLPARDAFPIIRELLLRAEDTNDLHIPLLLWWAIEDKAASNRDQVIELMKDPAVWKAPIFRQHIASRIGQRYAAERGESYYTFSGDYLGVYSEWKSKFDPKVANRNLETSARLLELASSDEESEILVRGMDDGLQGDTVKTVPMELERQITRLLARRPSSPALLSFALRTGNSKVADAAVEKLSDESVAEEDRKRLMAALADSRINSAVPALLDVLAKTSSQSLKVRDLEALRQFEDPRIANRIVELFPRMEAPVRSAALDTLISRTEWARMLVESVDRGVVKPKDVPQTRLVSTQNLGDARISELIAKHWQDKPEAKATGIVGQAFVKQGEKTYNQVCGYCHLGNGEGMKTPLVNSKWVLGPETVLANIVLHGKVGKEMTMPPMEGQLTDEQIATVLTYIRQNWENRAPAVDVETVSQVRQATRDRVKPWTEEELQKLLRK